MKQILTVFAYTFRDGARKKAFRISTILILALILVACLIPRAIEVFGGGEADAELPGNPNNADEIIMVDPAPEEDIRTLLYLIDDAGLIPDAEKVLSPLGFRVEPAGADELDRIRAEIGDDSANRGNGVTAVEITDVDGLPHITVYERDFMFAANHTNTSVIGDYLSALYARNTLMAQGVDRELIALARVSLPVATAFVGNLDLSGYVLGIVLTMLVFFAIYYYGVGVASSIATEKTSRVMETLIVSAPPSRILLGKCLGMGALGLCQYGALLVFAALCYKIFVPADFLIMGMPLSLSAFTPTSAVLLLIYFILGYALYAMLNAVCGAMVSKIEDLNSAMQPVMLLTMVSFYVAYFTAISGSGEGVFQKIAMYIPFCSPFIMPFKLLNSDVSAMSIVISIAALVVAIVIVAAISIRIYSASVLHYGRRMKWKEAYKTRI